METGLNVITLERRAGSLIDLVVSKDAPRFHNVSCYRFIELIIWISSKRLRSSDLRNTHANNKTEMAEGAAFHHSEEELKARSVTEVFCVGTNSDICVAHTAIHASKLVSRPVYFLTCCGILVRVGV